jgi:hypothetical protein
MKIYYQKSSGKVKEVGEGYNLWALIFREWWYLWNGMFANAIILVLCFFILVLANIPLFGDLILSVYIGAVANKHYKTHLINKGYKIISKKQAEKIEIIKSKRIGNKDEKNSQSFFKIVPWIILAIIILIIIKNF